ncbi:hypothetical protein [Herminiimonas aquatilis]|uniref:Uncharacterized protein n=1 Tax=Herminiimonas aquatilis TaxID=345342 RepID=A0ABW2J3W5_9BURK
MTDKKFTDNEGPLWIFAIGLVPGLAVALIQFILSWAEFSQISKFTSMKIKGVLNTRDEEEYYRDLITAAQSKIDVLGVTASRFASDFSNENSTREDKKVLIRALERGVKVRILVPTSNHLSARDRTEKFPISERVFGSLSQKYPNLMLRYFDHKAYTALVRVDDDALFGPVFDNVESRHTPAIHAQCSSVLSQSYLEHFKIEWNAATPFQQQS